MSFLIDSFRRIREAVSDGSTQRAFLAVLSLIVWSCSASGADKPARLTVHEAPRSLPEVSFTDASGGALTLADLHGRIVVLNVWATWCFPCREEMPTLDDLQAKFDPRDVTVIALSVDRKGLSPVRKFFDEIGVKHLSPYNDESARALRSLNLIGRPGTLLIDRAGRELGRLLGGTEWNRPETVEFLKTLVMQAPQGDVPEQVGAK